MSFFLKKKKNCGFAGRGGGGFAGQKAVDVRPHERIEILFNA